MAERKVVYATDFSKPSQFALRYASAQASGMNATLVMVHVRELTSSAGEAALYSALAKMDPKQELEAIAPQGFEGPCERHVLTGHPADELIRFAEEQAADLIVIGTHGRSGLSRVLMGSVAEQVLRRANCPVLVVRYREESDSAAP